MNPPDSSTDGFSNNFPTKTNKHFQFLTIKTGLVQIRAP